MVKVIDSPRLTTRSPSGIPLRMSHGSRLSGARLLRALVVMILGVTSQIASAEPLESLVRIQLNSIERSAVEAGDTRADDWCDATRETPYREFRYLLWQDGWLVSDDWDRFVELVRARCVLDDTLGWTADEWELELRQMRRSLPTWRILAAGVEEVCRKGELTRVLRMAIDRERELISARALVYLIDSAERPRTGSEINMRAYFLNGPIPDVERFGGVLYDMKSDGHELDFTGCLHTQQLFLQVLTSRGTPRLRQATMRTKLIRSVMDSLDEVAKHRLSSPSANFLNALRREESEVVLPSTDYFDSLGLDGRKTKVRHAANGLVMCGMVPDHVDDVNLRFVEQMLYLEEDLRATLSQDDRIRLLRHIYALTSMQIKSKNIFATDRFYSWLIFVVESAERLRSLGVTVPIPSLNDDEKFISDSTDREFSRNVWLGVTDIQAQLNVMGNAAFEN